jgi:Ca2+-transporting ATPase
VHRLWSIIGGAINGFFGMDGAQWAGAFAFNAFFSLFPLIVLLVTIASFFVDHDRAGKEVIAYLESYVPMGGEMRGHIDDTITGVIKAREQAGVVALLILLWSALQCFATLICATNRAWGTEGYNWWRLPLRSLVLLGITAGAVLLGMMLPVLLRMAETWLLPVNGMRSWVYDLGGILLQLVEVFLSLSLFYMFAPRRRTRFAEVWGAALSATVLLGAVESLFVSHLQDFAALNAVYGTFGGIMALLLWVYVSGCVFVFGACLCASWAKAQVLRASPAAE